MATNIHEAINGVMGKVGYVQKQRSGGLNYSFAGEAELISALRPEMVEQNLYMSVVALRDVVRGTYQTAKGATMNTVDLVAVVRFTHGPSASFIDVVALGSGADSGDKASNKAMTGAYKYALRQTFCIQTGDDPDSAPSVPRAASRKVDPATGEVTPGPNGDAKKDGSKLRQRWDALVTEAKALGLKTGILDEAADDKAIMEAGKALKARIDAAKAKAKPTAA